MEKTLQQRMFGNNQNMLFANQTNLSSQSSDVLSLPLMNSQQPYVPVMPLPNYVSTQQTTQSFQQPMQSFQQPMSQQPISQQPISQQPMSQQPMPQQPMLQQPMSQQPMSQQPMFQQPPIQSFQQQAPQEQQPQQQQPQQVPTQPQVIYQQQQVPSPQQQEAPQSQPPQTQVPQQQESVVFAPRQSIHIPDYVDTKHLNVYQVRAHYADETPDNMENYLLSNRLYTLDVKNNKIDMCCAASPGLGLRNSILRKYKRILKNLTEHDLVFRFHFLFLVFFNGFICFFGGKTMHVSVFFFVAKQHFYVL